MPYIQLDAHHATEIDAVDRQHEELAELVNELRASVAIGQPLEAQLTILRNLHAATQVHFEEEDRLFDEHGYPDAENHRAAHARLLNQLTGIERRVEAGKLEISHHLLSLLKDWLLVHIETADRAYAAFCRERMIAAKE